MRRTIICLVVGILLMVASHALQSGMNAQRETALPRQSHWSNRLDIERLNPGEPADYAKILFLLRNEDIPAATRIEYAKRYVRGEYPLANARLTSDKEQLRAFVVACAVVALARLNDVGSSPLLEEKYKDWNSTSQQEVNSPSGVVTPIPNLNIVRASLARLKAVQDIPEIRTSRDLIERLKRMLRYVGFEGSVDEWLKSLSKELDITYNSADLGTGLHERILESYLAMLMEAGWKGVDIDAAAKAIRLDFERYPVVRDKFETMTRLAKVPLRELARWIVDESVHWKVFSVSEYIKAQILLDLGTPVIPLIQEKLSWAWRNRDQIEGTGMGLVALTEVLVTLAGEQALPFLEPFTQDKNEWVRHYACRAKEYIQQGKVFVFAPYF